MGNSLIADEGSVFVEKEITEGTYVAESSGASALGVLSDGLDMVPSKELLQRNNRTATVEKIPSKVGTKGMDATVPMEFKANETEGASPEANDLWEGLLGGKRTFTATTSDTGHTTTLLELTGGDGAKYAVGDIIKVKEYDENAANPDHVSPIKAIVGDQLELLVPYFQAFTTNVVVAAGVTYFHQSGHPTLSLTQYLGGQIREKAIGMRVVSAELSNFSTGQLSNISFSLSGLSYDREVGTPLFTPTFDSSAPAVVLCAKVYQDTTELELNNVGITFSNTLGFKTSTASKNGKVASRVTEFLPTFTCNPYMSDADVDQFTKFDSNSAYSIFGSVHNPGAVQNEHLEVAAFYIPNCRTTEITTGNEDGILTDAISGEGAKNLGNDSIFISFS